jgi:hypothetical protein
MKNKRLITILAVVALLLLIPLIAMKFTNEVNWSIFDFLIMGTLLLATGLLCEFIMRKVTQLKTRLILCGLVLLMFLLVWIELAVGLFGTPFAGS